MRFYYLSSLVFSVTEFSCLNLIACVQKIIRTYEMNMDRYCRCMTVEFLSVLCLI